MILVMKGRRSHVLPIVITIPVIVRPVDTTLGRLTQECINHEKKVQACKL